MQVLGRRDPGGQVAVGVAFTKRDIALVLEISNPSDRGVTLSAGLIQLVQSRVVLRLQVCHLST
jgi:hypothetical protein